NNRALSHMRLSLLPLVCLSFAAYGQIRLRTAGEPLTNLHMQTIGANVLIAISVYDSPELTRAVRLWAAGLISVPMLREKIRAEGLMPTDLELEIGEALKAAEVLVAPLVTVTVVEYHSRPISVMGS